MIMKTHKRKLQPDQSSEDSPCSGAVAWEKQRQFVFSVSLRKYRRDQELPEPSLRRSVLISNTLRQVEACLASPPENSSPSPAKNQRMAEAEDWTSLSTDPDFGITPAVSSILSGLDSDASPRAALRSLENLQSCPDTGMSWLKQQVRGTHGQDLMEWEAGVEAARSSYLKDVTAEDMFQDIDTSQLESDAAALSLRAEEIPYHGAKGLPSFSSFSSPTTSLRDGLDLEHLVTMLVES
ncbi:SERTA domain-containing protein 2-like [Corythoichthys intestinalis]|uniref:SERTA domain-containing protein 2-like n=1 Tax=Corythoichthys intestinalis TaxID=161448 RepID=UPI0025A67B07|nr:SERTA domain-containing protein 2-like [Corythoichthys intestinalis]XP_057685081.1 SERTA domain-containing protein 2-like [Corythoichthys intestinalis]